MKSLELLDIIAIVSLYYQMDNNQQLKEQSTNDDILKEIKHIGDKLIEQNSQIIDLLKGNK